MKSNLLLLCTLTTLLLSCQLDNLKEPCKEGTHLDDNNECIPNSDLPEACGYPVQNCMEMPGVVYADCNSGECVAKMCAEGYHLNASECVYGASHDCESDDDCELLPNAKEITCNDNQCQITECETDYKLVANTCTPSSLNYCVSDSDCDIPNAQSVCTDNQCTIAECNEGYIQINEKCFSTASTPDLSCGSTDECNLLPHSLEVECKYNSYCSATACEEGFELKSYSPTDDIVMVFCAKADQMTCISKNDCIPLPNGTNAMKCNDYVCVATACTDGYRIEIDGDSCTEIMEHECIEASDCLDDITASEAVCEENKCKYITCIQDYHIKNDVCVNDTLSECGGVGEEFDCTAIPNVSIEKLKCTSAQCIVTECATGYALFNDTCIPEIIQSCGGLNCAELAGINIDHVDCIDDVCIAEQCLAGYHLINGTCFEDTDTECGDSLLNCTEGETAISHCVNGECVKTQCEPGKHIVDNECVEDTIDACGAALDNCTLLENTSKTSCNEGKCKIDECKPNFHIKEGQCVADSLNECGASLINCDSTIKDATEKKCEGGICKATKCNQNFHLKDNQCVKDSINECGTSLTNCETAIGNATERKCEGGVCKATKCINDFHLKNNQCVKDSPTECGSQMVNCNNIGGVATGTCSSGVCKASKCKSDYELDGGYCCYSSALSLTNTNENHSLACTRYDVRIGPNVRTLKMPNLVKVGGQLYTTSNESYLATLELPKLQTVNNGINFRNTSLTKLELPNFKSTSDSNYDFEISGNKKLTTISIPKTIKGKFYDVSIQNNPALESIKINTTSTYLYIQSNTKLTCKSICEGMTEITADRTYISENKDTACDFSGKSSGMLHEICGH